MAKVDKNWNTLRFQLTGASNGHFEKVCTLPPEVTLWRIHNLDELDVLWARMSWRTRRPTRATTRS